MASRRFRIEFTVDVHNEGVTKNWDWSNDDIKDFALQELECMSPYPFDITFSEVGNPWHTGTPIEEGDYLVAVKYPNLVGVEYELNRYLTEPYNSFIWELKGDGGKIVAWQKIDPFKEREWA